MNLKTFPILTCLRRTLSYQWLFPSSREHPLEIRSRLFTENAKQCLHLLSNIFERRYHSLWARAGERAR